MAEITGDEVNALYVNLKKDAEQGGYRLNPDEPFTKELISGLLVNKARYGYISCPCRLSAGTRAEDLDIICPCDYRDPDLSQYGSCYCGLYISEAIYRGARKLAPVPERRQPRIAASTLVEADGGTRIMNAELATSGAFSLKYPVWRCKVCGYLCAREEPPGICPVCKAGKDRFERFV